MDVNVRSAATSNRAIAMINTRARGIFIPIPGEFFSCQPWCDDFIVTLVIIVSDGHYLKRESLLRTVIDAGQRVFNNRVELSLNFEILFLLSRAVCFLTSHGRIGRRCSFSTLWCEKGHGRWSFVFLSFAQSRLLTLATLHCPRSRSWNYANVIRMVP